jgi:hypothetical protein
MKRKGKEMTYSVRTDAGQLKFDTSDRDAATIFDQNVGEFILKKFVGKPGRIVYKFIQNFSINVNGGERYLPQVKLYFWVGDYMSRE